MAKKTRKPPTPASLLSFRTLGILLALLALLGALPATRMLLGVTAAQAASQGPNLRMDDPRIVYTELAGQQSTLWIASAADPSRARRIATVGHREGYGLRARLSPD